MVALDEEALGRTGDTGRRGDGGVTSVCNIDVKIALACSTRGNGSVDERSHKTRKGKNELNAGF